MRLKTRYCIKWKSSEGKLVLKITDNTTVRFQQHGSSLFFYTLMDSVPVSEIQDILVHISQSIRGLESLFDAKDAESPPTRTISPSPYSTSCTS